MALSHHTHRTIGKKQLNHIHYQKNAIGHKTSEEQKQEQAHNYTQQADYMSLT